MESHLFCESTNIKMEPVPSRCSRDITKKKSNVSNIVWVCLKDMVTEKTLKEK